MTSVAWGSWIEIHPKTARHLGVDHGDVLRIESPFGSVEAPAYLYPGLRPDVIAMPLGQGHTAYGRYANGRGPSPLEIIAPEREDETGVLALVGTRVRLSKIGEGQRRLVTLEHENRQLGREIIQIHRIPQGTGEG